MSEARHIAVVGGGLTGSLLAVQLLRGDPAGQNRITLFEKSDRCGRGVAYSTRSRLHLLNIPACRMSLFPDLPDHFYDWLRSKGIECGRYDFAPRMIFGDYVEETLKSAIEREKSARVVRDEVVDLRPGAAGEVEIALKSGAGARAGLVVLATGINKPVPLPLFEGFSNYVDDPWQPGRIDKIPGGSEILIVGTGLTMIDVAMLLLSEKPDCKVVAVSRHGYLPAPHVTAEFGAAAVSLQELFECGAIPAIVKRMRLKVEEVRAQGLPWQSVFEEMRGVSRELWSTLPPQERKRFSRHVKSIWSILRHRVAESLFLQIKEWIEQGRLEVIPARPVSAAQSGGKIDVTLHRRGAGCLSARADWIVNCAGPDENPERSGGALINSLLASGVIRRDPPNPGLISTDDRVIPLGWPASFGLPEIPAVPEIREQCAALVRRICARGVTDERRSGTTGC